VDLPVAVVDVDRVLEQDGELDERGGVPVLAVEVGEVALDLRAQAVLPPVEEVVGVVGEDEAEVRADRAGVLAVAGDARDVAGLVRAPGGRL